MSKTAGVGCGFMLAAMAMAMGVAAAIACWTDRTLDFWLTYWQGRPIDVNWWWSFLLSLTGPLVLLANLVSEIARSVV